MTGPDTRVVDQTLRISARRETVWRYWTDPQRLCQWWGAAAELDPQAGGVCVVEMGGGGVMRGEFVELMPNERLVFTSGWEPVQGGPDIPPGSTRVEVILTEDAGDTIMTLRHTLPAHAADEHDKGWAHFLPLLADAAGGGQQGATRS